MLRLPFFVVLSSLLIHSYAVAAPPSEEITFDGRRNTFEIDLSGVRSKTNYRYEDYSTTCTREVPETIYVYECDYRNVHFCKGNDCRTVREAINCGDRPRTHYRTETYGCTQTRAIPIGTEVVEELEANVKIEFVGDLSSFSGQEKFVFSVPHGTDSAATGLVLSIKEVSTTHLFKKLEVSENKVSLGPKRSRIEARYKIELIDLKNLEHFQTRIRDFTANRGQLTLFLEGAPLHSKSRVTIHAEKDPLLGKPFSIGHESRAYDTLKIVRTPQGEEVTFEFGADGGYSCLRRRPYEFTVVLESPFPESIREGVLNTKLLSNFESGFSSDAKKRIRLKGSKSTQCSN